MGQKIVQAESFRLQRALRELQAVVVELGERRRAVRLRRSIAGLQAAIVELSWYGNRKVPVALGEGFHSRRLSLVSSQVGAVATAQRARWDRGRRLALALDLLADPRFDVLLEPPVPFVRLPEVMAALTAQPSKVMCQVVNY